MVGYTFNKALLYTWYIRYLPLGIYNVGDKLGLHWENTNQHLVKHYNNVTKWYLSHI